jgi:hypothetical protein
VADVTVSPDVTPERPFREVRAELAASIERVLRGELALFELFVFPKAWVHVGEDEPIPEMIGPESPETFSHHAEAILRLTQAYSTLTNPGRPKAS